jgi:hypothetical protein
MGSADCEPRLRLVPGRPRHVYLQGGLSSPPRAGAVSSLLRSCGAPWSPRFAQPIVLEEGAKLASLRQAIAHLVKTSPPSERSLPAVLAAAELLTAAAEHGGPPSNSSCADRKSKSWTRPTRFIESHG